MHKAQNISISLLLIIHITFCNFFVYAQEKAHKKINIQKKLSLARYAFENKNYYAAIDLYKELHVKDSINYEYCYKLGEIYDILREYSEASKWYKTTLNIDSTKHTFVKLKYSQMLIRDKKYEKAKKMLSNFLNTYNDTNEIYYKNIANKELNNCNFSLKTLNDSLPSLIVVKNLGNDINSSNSDFAPLQYDSLSIIFSSINIKKKNENSTNINNNLVQIYIATKNDNEDYTVQPFFPSLFNSEKMHTANGAISSDGNRFYFTRCNCENITKPICSIYLSIKENGEWSEPIKLGNEVNEDGFTSTHPSIAYNKKDEILFFVSDRPKGQGGYDIWYSIVSNGKTYSTATNIGKSINTEFNEITPFYDYKNNALYFSSDGYPGYGGLDIFKSEKIKNKWNVPENIGLPYNSVADDFYYINIKNDSTGYLVSNRKSEISESTCCDDIYKFEKIIKPILIIENELFLMGKIFTLDDSTKKIINNVYLILTIDSTGEKQTYLINNNDFFIKLNPKTNYTLSVNSNTYISNDRFINTNTYNYSDTIYFEIGMKRKFEKNKAYTLNNIYFDFDKATLRHESIEVLDSLVTVIKELLQDYSGIEISAHTDSKGNDDYNLKLSQLRADIVVEYLIKNGIDKNKLIAKGYGETKPIDSNTKFDGSDNPDGRQLNRRVEFKIL